MYFVNVRDVMSKLFLIYVINFVQSTTIQTFKTKWGGIPFLHYEFCLYEHQHKNIVEMLLQNM